MNVSLSLVLLASGQGTDEFELRAASGEPRFGSLERVAADGTVTLANGALGPGGEWYSLRRTSGRLPPWPREPHVELLNGDRIRGVLDTADGDALRLRLTIGDEGQLLRFPLSAVRTVWLGRRPDRDPDWLRLPRSRDVFLARNGDRTSGALTGINPAQGELQFQSEGKDRRLDLGLITAVAFNSELARDRRPRGAYYRLVLADGSRISASGVSFDGRVWTIQNLFREALRVPADRVLDVSVERGRAVCLSAVEPARYQYDSYDGERRVWSADRGVTGNPIRLQGPAGESTHDRGIGLQAGSAVTYNLAGRYTRFEALVGLDSRTGTRGDVVLSIRVDGKDLELPQNGHLTSAGGSRSLRVDLDGAQELTITVRRGMGGFVQDHVNLADACLILANK